MNLKKIATAVAAMMLASVGIVGCAQEESGFPDRCTWTGSPEEYEKQTGIQLDRSGCGQQDGVDIDIKKPKKPKAPKPTAKQVTPAPAPAPAPKPTAKQVQPAKPAPAPKPAKPAPKAGGKR